MIVMFRSVVAVPLKLADLLSGKSVQRTLCWYDGFLWRYSDVRRYNIH